MRLSRRSLSVAGFSLVGLAVVFAACTDDTTSPVGPEPPVVTPPTVPGGMLLVECRAELTTRSVSCGDPAGDGASYVMLGNQNVYVRLNGTGQEVLGTDTLAFDLTVQNLLRQPVDGRKQNFGTTDGTTLDPAGVRVFFHTVPVGNVGSVDVVNATGQATFTASNQDYFQYNQVLDSGVVSAPYAEKWKLHFQGGATSATWMLMVATEVPLPNGWVDILPESTSVYVDSSATVTATVRSFAGNAVGGSVTFASNNPAIASIHPTSGVITGEAIGQTTVTATSGLRTGSAVVIVPSNPPVIDPDSIGALENVTTPVDSANGLYPNIDDMEGDADVVAGTFTTPEGGTARIYANGSYDYLNEAGFTGKDTIYYDVDDGSNVVQGYVVVQVVPSNYFYVKQGAAGTTDGRDRFPFASLANAQAVAGTGDSIFVLYAGVTQLDGPLVMEDGQALIGQGITGDITRTFNTLPVTVLADSSAPGVTRSTAGATITLANTNIIAGIGLASGNGAAIAGSNFGTLTTHSLTVGATGGPALDLTTGTLAGTFTTLSSTNSSTRGVFLSGVGGTLNATGGAISGATGVAVEVVGGAVGISYGGNVTQGNSAALLSVSGGHTGTLTFTGTLNATAGTGLQFNDADGTYNFNGTTTLNGGDAGVDITNGSAGNFGFATTTTITSPSGTAFAVNGSSPSVVYSGGITKASAGLLVDVSSQPGGTVTFQTGTLQATAGTGVQLNDADGTVNFTGVTTLGGGDAGVDVMGGSTGAITFGTNASISNTSGVGLHVLNSAPNLSYGGSVAENASSGSPVTIDGASSCGTISLTGNINSQNLGIVVQDCGNAATNITFSGGNKTLNTGANAAVTLTNNALGAIGFTSGGLGITTTTGAGFTASGGGIVQVTGAGNSISSGTGTALSLNGMTLHANGMNWGSGVSAAGAANGVNLTNVTAGGTITGTGGTITGGAGAAFLVSGGSVNATFTSNISQATASQPLVSVAGGHSGTLTFGTGTLSATNGTGLQFNDADGAYNFNGTTTLNGGDAGIDMLAGSDGDFVFGTGVAITNPSGTGVFTSASSPDVTYSGTISKNSAGWLVDTFDTGGGTITFQTGNLSATGTSTGITFNDADGTVNFSGPSTALSGGTARINVQGGSSGAITFNSNTSVAGPSGAGALHMTNGGNPTSFSYAGSLTANAAGRPAHIEGVSSGTVTVSGSITSSGGQGLLMQTNAGGTITFSGSTKTFNTGTQTAVSSTGSGASVLFSGGNLDIDVTSGTGFNFTGGGSVEVTGANNSVNATAGGTAVNISSTTIAANGVTFVRVDATGSGSNGIVLSSTGSGGFQVTGDGASDPANTTRGRTTAGAGGPIALGSGGSISGRSGHGVSLATTGAVILRNMVITGSGSSGDGINANTTGRLTVDNTRITAHASDHGILGQTVGGLAIHHSEIDNNGTTVGVVEGPDIWNVRLVGVTGTDSIRNSNIHHSQEHVVGIINTSGVLNLTVLNTNITDTGTGAGGSIAFMVQANGSSNVTLNFQSDSINRGRARGIQTSTETAASATLNLTVNNSQFINNGMAVENAHGSSGTNTFSITNNNMQTGTPGTVGVGSLQTININRLGSPSFNGFGLFTGTISGNTIGTAGTANSGSDTGSGIEVESNGSGGITRVAVVSNTIREVAVHGIYVAAVDANIGGAAPPLMEARVASNTVSNLEGTALDGIHVLPGALNTDDLTMCIDIANNNSTGIRNGLRVRPSGLPAAPSTVQLEGWDGVTAVNTYFTARPNTLAGGVAAISTTAPPAPGGFFAVANCNTP